MSDIVKVLGAALLFLAAACQGAQEAPASVEPEAPGPDLAAATTDLPVTHILLGEISATPSADGLSVVNIKPILSAPAYQNQPAFLGLDQAQFYYVAGSGDGKTDLWVYDLASGERSKITDTPQKSEFSPKSVPGGRLSYIQESEDGAMTHVHVRQAANGAGAAVTDVAPVGYYEWLRGGAALAVFYRSEPPELKIVDVASGEARSIFANVGRVLQASPDGAILFATRADENEQYEIVAVDVVTGATEPVLTLPAGAQDFFLTFDDYGNPAIAFSSMGTQLMTYAFADDVVWRVAADIGDLGYGSISRIAVSLATAPLATGEGIASGAPILIVAHPKSD